MPPMDQRPVRSIRRYQDFDCVGAQFGHEPAIVYGDKVKWVFPAEVHLPPGSGLDIRMEREVRRNEAVDGSLGIIGLRPCRKAALGGCLPKGHVRERFGLGVRLQRAAQHS